MIAPLSTRLRQKLDNMMRGETVNSDEVRFWIKEIDEKDAECIKQIQQLCDQDTQIKQLKEDIKVLEEQIKILKGPPDQR